MPRKSPTFRQRDFVRAVKAARVAGLDVIETKIGSDGSIALIHKSASVPDDAEAALKAWQAKRHGTHSA
jgi:hypothetical protein